MTAEMFLALATIVVVLGVLLLLAGVARLLFGPDPDLEGDR